MEDTEAVKDGDRLTPPSCLLFLLPRPPLLPTDLLHKAGSTGSVHQYYDMTITLQSSFLIRDINRSNYHVPPPSVEVLFR